MVVEKADLLLNYIFVFPVLVILAETFLDSSLE